MTSPEEQKRFDNWPAIVPKVGTVVQIQFKRGEAREGVVTYRETKDGKTFVISIPWPYSNRSLELEITPGAPTRRTESHRRPYWQTVPSHTYEERVGVKLFFLDDMHKPSGEAS